MHPDDCVPIPAAPGLVQRRGKPIQLVMMIPGRFIEGKEEPFENLVPPPEGIKAPLVVETKRHPVKAVLSFLGLRRNAG